MKQNNQKELLNSLQRTLSRSDSVQFHSSPVKTKLNTKPSLLGSMLTLSEAKLVPLAIKKKMLKNIEVSYFPLNTKDKVTIQDGELSSKATQQKNPDGNQKILETEVKKQKNKFPNGMVFEENYMKSENSVRFLLPKTPTVQTTQLLFPAEQKDLSIHKKSQSQHILLHTIHQGSKIQKNIQRNTSQESQLNNYLASIRKINESRTVQNIRVQKSNILNKYVEGSSHNSTLLAQTSLPSSTKHHYSKYFVFFDDKSPTQQIEKFQDQSSNQLELLLERTKKKLNQYQTQIKDQKQIIQDQNKQIEQLKNLNALYESKQDQLNL